CKRVRALIKAGHALIIIAGGDGSQTSVVGEFAHRDAVLGVIPAGTGNSFATGLGIGEELQDAVDVIVDGKIAKIDLGRVNKTYFANFSTIGLASEVGNETSHGLKSLLGPVAYGIAAVGPILTHKPFRARVKYDGNTLKLKTHQVIIANGRDYGHQPISPDATFTDKRLAFFATSGTSRIDILKMYVALIRGRQQSLRDAQYFSARKIELRTTPRVQIDIDGNAFERTPAKFSVAPGALRVMVPSAFGEKA
ncbi:MAG: YegS/Rv2252/BmrU family lipid kinase, partial [Candidatus Baltobacteraceae bacterium]